jgi:hypothetical protein
MCLLLFSLILCTVLGFLNDPFHYCSKFCVNVRVSFKLLNFHVLVLLETYSQSVKDYFVKEIETLSSFFELLRTGFAGNICPNCESLLCQRNGDTSIFI